MSEAIILKRKDYKIATSTQDGLLSSDDKNKLNNIEEEANNYIHPKYENKNIDLYKITVDSTGHVSETSNVTKKDITDLGIPEQDTIYTHPKYNSINLGLYKFESDSTGHISNAESITKKDIVDLGIPEQDTTYTHPSYNPKAFGLYKITVDDTGHIQSAIEVKKSDIENLGFDGTSSYIHPSYTPKNSGLYKITVDSTGHVSETSNVTKKDITDLGVPEQDTVYTHPSYTKRNSGLYKITVDDTGHVTNVETVSKNDITSLGIPEQDTTYENVSESKSGLMLSADKKKLDEIPSISYGSWTPNVSFGGNSAISYSQRIGKYSKIGDVVTLAFRIRCTAPVTGDIVISGFSSVCGNATQNCAGGGIFLPLYPYNSAYAGFIGYQVTGTNSISPIVLSSSADSNGVYSTTGQGVKSSSVYLYGSLTYYIS